MGLNLLIEKFSSNNFSNKCVSILNRIQKLDIIDLKKPTIETFGNNIGIITSSVFNLEVTQSGFHTILQKLVDENDSYEEVLDILENQLGPEGRSILLSMFELKER